MKRCLSVLLLAPLLGCLHKQVSPVLSVEHIEQSSFKDVYQFWRREKDSLSRPAIPTGSTDSHTGRFTPTTFWVLTCRLGRDAHLHLSFLTKELATDADVHMILEASSPLCDHYGIDSKAQVEFVPEHDYRHRMTDGWSPQVQQRRWLEAVNRAEFRQDGEVNGTRPIHSDRNRTSSAAQHFPTQSILNNPLGPE